MLGGCFVVGLLHAGSNQLNVVSDDLGGIALVAVAVLVVAGLKPALDNNLLALGRVFVHQFGCLPKRYDVVPLG